jgi:hypothetical protein
MTEPENRWTDSDEILYGRYAIGDYPKLELISYNLKYQHGGQTNL